MTNLENIEVELKFPLKNPEQLIKKLNSIAKQQKQRDYQKDVYYIPPHRNFLKQKPISEWLRIRETKKGFGLNYKKWHSGEKVVSCDEFEINIDNISELKKIFEALNFEEIIVVEKTRDTWSCKDTQIAIDNVTDLGRFIEIEAKGNFKDIEEAKEHLYSILKELNAELGEQDFKGYPHRMLERKGML